MLISFVIPVFNGEKVLGRCLESLMAIKEKELEFIVVNDGSNDNTERLCNQYIQKDNRICLINQKNQGVSKARNTGINVARGTYISFVDADDEVLDEYNEIICVLKNIDSDLYSFPYYIQTKTTLKKQERSFYNQGVNSRKLLYSNFLSENSNCVWNNIYKNSIIKKNNIYFPQDMSMGEDCLFNAQYFRHCNSVYYIDVIGYKYYVDDSTSASKQRKVSYLKDFVKIYNCLTNFYNSYEGLNFSFGCRYYFDMVYEILSQNRRILKREEKEEFRKSDFYKKIIKCEYKGKKRLLRKWIIRFIIYF